MKRALTLTALAFASLALLAAAQEPSARQGGEHEAPFLSRRGYPELPPCSDEEVIFTECDLLLHLDKWRRRDGAIGFYLSDYFVDAAMSYPNRFFAVMAQHRDDFDEWLARLPNLSFTDMGGCCEGGCTECKRLALLESVRGFLNRLGAEQRELAEALIRRLNEIEIRVVE